MISRFALPIIRIKFELIRKFLNNLRIKFFLNNKYFRRLSVAPWRNGSALNFERVESGSVHVRAVVLLLFWMDFWENRILLFFFQSKSKTNKVSKNVTSCYIKFTSGMGSNFRKEEIRVPVHLPVPDRSSSMQFPLFLLTARGQSALQWSWSSQMEANPKIAHIFGVTLTQKYFIIS